MSVTLTKLQKSPTLFFCTRFKLLLKARKDRAPEGLDSVEAKAKRLDGLPPTTSSAR